MIGGIVTVVSPDVADVPERYRVSVIDIVQVILVRVQVPFQIKRVVGAVGARFGCLAVIGIVPVGTVRDRGRVVRLGVHVPDEEGRIAIGIVQLFHFLVLGGVQRPRIGIQGSVGHHHKDFRTLGRGERSAAPSAAFGSVVDGLHTRRIRQPEEMPVVQGVSRLVGQAIGLPASRTALVVRVEIPDGISPFKFCGQILLDGLAALLQAENVEVVLPYGAHETGFPVAPVVLLVLLCGDIARVVGAYTDYIVILSAGDIRKDQLREAHTGVIAEEIIAGIGLRTT